MIPTMRWISWGAVGALLAPLGLGAWILLGPDPEGAVAGVGEQGVGPTIGVGVPLDSLTVVARQVAPFRPDGRPSRVAYDPGRSEVAAQDYQTPKPVLVLTGVMEGVEPLAVLEGIPGREGPALLGVGDTLAGLKVRRIREGKVTITGMDTTWVLTIRGLP